MENSVESSHNISGLKRTAQENLSKKPSGLEMALSDIRAVIISKGLLGQKPELRELPDQNHNDLVAELRIKPSPNILNPKTIRLETGLDALEKPLWVSNPHQYEDADLSLQPLVSGRFPHHMYIKQRKGSLNALSNLGKPSQGQEADLPLGILV